MSIDKIALQTVNYVSWEALWMEQKLKSRLTVTAVEGRKVIVMTTNAFIAELSQPVAFAMTWLESAMLWLRKTARCASWLFLCDTKAPHLLQFELENGWPRFFLQIVWDNLLCWAVKMCHRLIFWIVPQGPCTHARFHSGELWYWNSQSFPGDGRSFPSKSPGHGRTMWTSHESCGASGTCWKSEWGVR